MTKYRRIQHVVGAMAELETAIDALDADAKKIEDKQERLQKEYDANREQWRRLKRALIAMSETEQPT